MINTAMSRRVLLAGSAAIAAAPRAPAQPAASLPAASLPLDAAASDPVKLGWMTGAPVPPDKLVRFEDGGSWTFPKTRWAFSNVRQLQPTVAVPRGDGPAATLSRALRGDLDAVRFTPLADSGFGPMRWAESLAVNYTDGILVLHRGRVVYERYFGVLGPAKQHLTMSITKSFVGTLAATLAAEGKLDPASPVAGHVPELAKSGFGDATVRDLMDMRTGIAFSEAYGSTVADSARMAWAGGIAGRPPGYAGPDGFAAYYPTVGKAGPHGGAFAYKTANTDVLAWVLARVTGRPIETLIAERLWVPLGMAQDGYMTVDAHGMAFAGGGLCATLGDLARFGELMRRGGEWGGKRLIPAAVVADIERGGDKTAFAKADYKRLPGASYRDQWWVLHNAHGAYSARGIHGQAIYIDPRAEMVIARLASHPLGSNSHYDATSLPAYHAVAERLMGRG